MVAGDGARQADCSAIRSNERPFREQRWHLLRWFILLVLGTSLAVAPAAFACSHSIVPFPEKVKRSPLVVVGTVIEIRVVRGRHMGIFQIEQVLKGAPPASQLELPFRAADDGSCGGTVEYRLGARHLLIYSGTAGRLDRYPHRFDATPVLTAENVRRCLRIVSAEDLDEKRALYRSMFESGDRVFLNDALDGLKRLRAADAGLVANVLLRALSSDVRSEDYWIIEELARTGDGRAVAAFIALASSNRHRDLRRAAIDALGRFEAREAVWGLMGLAARDPDATVRSKSIEALVQIGASGITDFLQARLSLEKDPSVRGLVLAELAAVRHADAAALAIEAFRSAELEERLGAYRAAARLGLKEAFPELARRLGGSVASLEQQAIARALVEIDGVAAAHYLIPMLEPRRGGRWASALLGKTRSDAAKTALLTFMDRDLSVGNGMLTPALLEPLLELGGEATAAVVALIGHPNHFLRAKAIQALGKFRVAAAFGPLTAGLSDSATGGEAAGGLLKIDYEKALPFVLRWLAQDDRSSIPPHCLWAFVERRDRRALDLIESRIRNMPDDDYRDSLARAAEAIRSAP